MNTHLRSSVSIFSQEEAQTIDQELFSECPFSVFNKFIILHKHSYKIIYFCLSQEGAQVIYQELFIEYALCVDQLIESYRYNLTSKSFVYLNYFDKITHIRYSIYICSQKEAQAIEQELFSDNASFNRT